MQPFYRRMLEGTAFLRAPDDGMSNPPAGAADGSTPTPPEPVVAPTPDAVVPPPADGVDPAAPAEPAAPAVPDTAAPATNATQSRIAALTAEKWQARREKETSDQRAALLQSQLDAIRQAQPQVDADGNPVAPVAPAASRAPQQTVVEMAAQMAAETAFQTSVANEIQRARGLHTDFDQVAQNLQKFGELPRVFVEAAMATGKGAEVIYALGNDAAEADRLLTLAHQSPLQMAVGMANLAAKIPAAVPAKLVSSAPPPIGSKVTGKTTNTPSIEDPNIPIADFIKMREASLAKNKTSARR